MSTQRKDQDHPLDHWWGKVIFGVGAIGIAIWLNKEFLLLESGTMDSIRIHVCIGLPYQIFGRAPTVIGLVVIGIALLVRAAIQFIRDQQADNL